MSKPVWSYFDPLSMVVIVLTLALFIIALFVKGFTHELLQECGVFLVSVKLIMMSHKNGSPPGTPRNGWRRSSICSQPKGRRAPESPRSFTFTCFCSLMARPPQAVNSTTDHVETAALGCPQVVWGCAG